MEELFSAGHLPIADELIAEDYVEHSPLPGQEPGLGGLKHALKRFWVAFPDFHLSIEDLIAEGDRVVTKKTMTGTHTGEFNGITPTGRRVELQYVDILRLRDGQITEHWLSMDQLSFMQQLGVIPS